MNIDPREQAHAYDDWHVEDVPEPEMPEDRSEVRQVPEAVAAADVVVLVDVLVLDGRVEVTGGGTYSVAGCLPCTLPGCGNWATG